ncbi:MAG: hypothetical protein Q9173_002395 [Seirophora scorigena]
MPLESPLKILEDTKDQKVNPLASKLDRIHGNITTLRKDNSKPFDNSIKSEDVPDEFLAKVRTTRRVGRENFVQVTGDGSGDTMESYENKGIENHDKAPKKRSTQIREENNVECKSKSKKPKCPLGQMIAMIKNAPICGGTDVGMHPVEAADCAAYTIMGLRTIGWNKLGQAIEWRIRTLHRRSPHLTNAPSLFHLNKQHRRRARVKPSGLVLRVAHYMDDVDGTASKPAEYDWSIASWRLERAHGHQERRELVAVTSKRACDDSSLSLVAPTYWNSTVEELCGFDYFRIQTSDDLAYSLNSSTDELVLQTSHHHEAIRNAAIALGSLGGTIRINSLFPGCGENTLFWERHEFARGQYYKAIRILQKDIGRDELESVNYALISCFLFVVFEFLQGNDQSAVAHLQSRLKILRQQNLPGSNHVTNSHPVQAEIARIFRTLDWPATMWLDLRTFTLRRHISGGSPLSREMVPESFDTLNEASDELSGLISRVYSLRRDASKHDSAPTRAHVPASIHPEREALLDELDVHRRRLRNYLAGRQSMAQRPEDPHRITLLRINRKVATLMLAICLEPRESLLCAGSQPHFLQIVSLAALILRPETSDARRRMMMKRGMYAGSTDPTSMDAKLPRRQQVLHFFAGLIQLLYFTAIKRPDRETAMKAIELLEIQPWHEDSWDSVAMATIARRSRRMQEPDRTGWNRFVAGEAHVDDACGSERGWVILSGPLTTDPTRHELCSTWT